MQNKKKKNIKVRDLKPRKDAKGGFVVTNHNPSTHGVAGHGVSGHGVSGHGVARPSNPNT